VTAPKDSPSEGAEEQGGTACGAYSGAVAPERAPDTERAGAETIAGEAVNVSGPAGASPPAVDLAPIKERWAPVFNGFIDLTKVGQETLREKFVLMLLDVDALIREVVRLREIEAVVRAAGEAESGVDNDAVFDAASDALWAMARKVAVKPARDGVSARTTEDRLDG